MPSSAPASLLARIAARHGTPVWVYDAEVIRGQIALLAGFGVIRYAQKANPNLHILRLMRESGALVDAVSAGELERAIAAGFDPRSEIVYTADILDREALERVLATGVPVNAGSPQMLEQVGARAPGHPVWLRINPGFGHGHSRKTNTGGEGSKHGIWHENLGEGYDLISRHGLELRGLHMHIGSGADYEHLGRVADAMLRTVRDCPFEVRSISAGGGLPIAEDRHEARAQIAQHLRRWERVRDIVAKERGIAPVVEVEPGRFLVAQAGTLVTTVRARKMQGQTEFVLVDAGFNDLIRPAMYGADHPMSVLSPDGVWRDKAPRPMLVAGPLCESGDVFTQDPQGVVRPVALSPPQIDDLIAIHDVGAYGASMSSNYNSRPLATEVLVDGDSVEVIRRRQTIEELMALEISGVTLMAR